MKAQESEAAAITLLRSYSESVVSKAWDSLKQLDSKLVSLCTILGVGLTFVVNTTPDLTKFTSLTPRILLGSSQVSISIGFLIALWSLYPRQFKWLTPIEYYKQLGQNGLSSENIQVQMINNMIEVEASLAIEMKRKGRCLAICSTLTTFAMLCLASFAILRISVT